MNTPVVEGVTSILFLSNSLEIGPDAFEDAPVTFSPLVIVSVSLATTLR